MRWIEVAPPGAATSIVLAHGYGGWSEEKVGQFTGIGLEADDIEATYRELSGRGVTFTEKPTKQPWGWQAQFVDKDGNGYVLGQTGA
jgi:lactoylglutathione lyase